MSSFYPDGNATIQIYYDRASYFIYFQTGTTEVQIDPIKVQYGAALPSLEDYSKQLHPGQGIMLVTTEDDISWYRLDDSGAVW